MCHAATPRLTQLTANYTVNVEHFIITGFYHLQNQKLLWFLILITYMLILLGNDVNLCIILTDRHLHKPMYILICNLAVVDIMYTSTSSTTMISVLLAKIKTVSYYSCISRMFFHHLGNIKVYMALTLMALDRLTAIRFPLRYHSIVTNSRTFVLIIITWLISFSVMVVLTNVLANVPYCQPVIRYVFCDYASMIRAACVVLNSTEQNAVLIPPLINPTVYCIRTKEIRKRIRDLFLLKRTLPNHFLF